MIHKDIESLDEAAQPIFKAFLAKLDEYGIRYAVIETWRSQDVQVAYYAQGRKPLDIVNSLRKLAGLWLIGSVENKNIITQCDGITTKSKHQFGKAMDIAPADAKGNPIWDATDGEWEEIGSIGEKMGLTWGAHFKGLKDNPHFEVA